MKKEENNLAYIDGANLYNGIASFGWSLDYARFRVWLKEKYSVKHAYIFLGLIPKYKELYKYLQESGRTARRKHKEFQKEMREAEESIRRGFAVLKRDIQAQLAIIQKADLGKGLSAEQKKQEGQLRKDLAWAESYIGKEIWDIEDTEHKD